MRSKRTPHTRRINHQVPRPTRRLLLLELLEGRALLAANLVADIAPSGASNPHDFVPSAAGTFFVANDGTSGEELWLTDGTAHGTRRMKDIRPGLNGSQPQHLTDMQGTLYFAADNGLAGTELWKSDGTVEGTLLVKNLRSKSDGSEPRDLTAVGDKLFFVANDGERGAELWISDGTAHGTKLLKEIVDGEGSSNPQQLTAVGGRLFFTAVDTERGAELWTSDGTEAGTKLVKDLVAGNEGSQPADLTAVGERVFFTATTEDSGTELWVSDGTAAGTEQVLDIRQGSGSSQPGDLTSVGNVLYFHAHDGLVGDELWSSDGTASGTALVKDIRPGASGSSPAELTHVDGQLYLRAHDGEHGAELWISDGTAGGTRMVADLRAGSENFNPASLTEFDGQVYFRAATTEAGAELWRSDGSPENTVLLRDVRAGSAGSSPVVQAAVDGQLYFTADDGLTGNELWAFRETLGTVAFLESSSAVTEGAAGMTLTVQLTTDGNPMDSPLSVEVRLVDGTATDGVDIGAFAAATITFPRGSTSGSTRSIDVRLIDDTLVEAEESLEFRLSNLVGPGFIAGDENDGHHVAIADNDFAAVRFVASASTADEASTGVPIGIELVTTPANATLAAAAAVTLSRSGGTTAPNADLQSFTATTFVFPAGTGSGEQRSLTLVPLEDRLVEGDETVELSLHSAVAPLSVVADAQDHMLTIHDRNTAVVEFATTQSTAGEDSGVQLLDVRLVTAPANSRLAAEVRVQVNAAGGTGTNGLDYANFAAATLVFPAGTTGSATQQIGLAIRPDDLVEGAETVALEVTSVAGPVTVDPDARQHLVTIADADAATIRFDDAATSTGENIGEYPVTARLAITPSTARLAVPVTVVLQRSGGTASNGVDFADFAAGTLTFASGAGHGDHRSLPLHLTDDNLVEGVETITFELAGLTGPAVLGEQTARQTVTIADGDFATVSYVSSTSSVDENGTPHGIPVRLTTVPNTATLANDSTVELFVAGGSASNGVDYAEFVPLRLAFDAGAGDGLTRTVHLTPLDDNVFEGDETVTFGLRNARGLVVLEADGDTHVATLLDNEADPDVDDDQDGVPSAVEALAPHGGDGNQDGTADAEQSDVASLPSLIDGAYITLASAGGTTLSNVRAVDNPAPATTPAYAAFSFGFFEFAVQVAEAGTGAEVRIIPSSLVPATIYMQYGPDQVSARGHWFLLHDDGATGATFTAGHIALRLVDGGRGDIDLTADGLVRVLAAPGLNQAAHPWQNPVAATDVNGDQFISPLDALIVINTLSSAAETQLPVPLTPPRIPPNFLDVSGDDLLSPLDALQVVNDLHVNGIRAVVAVDSEPLAEGEGSAAPALMDPATGISLRQSAGTGHLPSNAKVADEVQPLDRQPTSAPSAVAAPDVALFDAPEEDHNGADDEWGELLDTLALDVALRCH